MSNPQVLVVGEVVLDVLDLSPEQPFIRLGGLAHACSTLGAMGIAYAAAYVSPSYLTRNVADFFEATGDVVATQIGETLLAPGVILIRHAQEAIQQGYELLLRNQGEYQIYDTSLNELASLNVPDILLLPGNFPLRQVLSVLGRNPARLHVDWANASPPISDLSFAGRPATTLLLSTSSDHFLTGCQGRFDRLFSSVVPAFAESVLLKENRGGARYASARSGSLEAGAQLRAVRHSVGVGDCFDAAFVAMSSVEDLLTSIRRATWLSAEYGQTLNSEVFKRQALRAKAMSSDELAASPGIRLGWEERAGISVYIAGPDFSSYDRRNIDAVDQALRYHNFRSRRPIQENGELRPNAGEAERRHLCSADLAMLAESELVVGVYDFDDPGTLVEIGIATGLNKPVILFDPNHRADNLMLTGVCRVIAHDLDELIRAVFVLVGRRL